MITASTDLQNVLKQNSSVKMDIGCYIEYNMNMLTNLTSSSITGPSYKVFGDNRQPFKKLFPLDTIIKSFRPNGAGIKYAIAGDVSRNYTDANKAGDYKDPSSTTYPYNYRTYYPGVDTYYKYWVSNIGEGGTISISYPKTIVTNKIVVKFEVSHDKPSTWTIYGTPVGGPEGTLATGTSANIPGFTSGSYDAGVLTIYYTGSTWTTDASLHNVNSYVSLSSIKLTFPGVTNRYIGIIEFAPIWVKDISSDIVDFSISKSSSSNEEDILPVGLVTANSLSINLNKFNNTVMQILSYDKSNSYAIDASKIYLYKQIKFKPYFKVYHENGSYGLTGNKYDVLNQGIFYVDSWDADEYNEVSVTCLDSAKILQETIAPSMICENYAITAILRRLLDSIGFTNYKFNLTATDQSVISPNYWWTDDSKTVWQLIQELCRDTQMTAVVDENDVLQFYSRDYMYSNRTESWQFNYDADESSLPNIVSLTKKDLPSTNQVKILWKSATTSNYEKNSDIIWKSENTFLAAAALSQDLNATDVSTYDVNGNISIAKYLYLEPVTTSGYENQKNLYSFSGYLVIEDEIIEYDAIQYDLILLDAAIINGISYTANARVSVDITSNSDVFKYRGLAKNGSGNFQPNGKYRIKERGSFGTGPTSGNPGYPHRSGTSEQLNSWTVKEVFFSAN
jgi:hypothetical protein